VPLSIFFLTTVLMLIRPDSYRLASGLGGNGDGQDAAVLASYLSVTHQSSLFSH
jgi:hypothetical protein